MSTEKKHWLIFLCFYMPWLSFHSDNFLFELVVLFNVILINYLFYQILCKIVAALIQYFFLCAFLWMLGEGVILYVLLVKVFGNLADRWYLLIPVCWGKSKLELLLFLHYQSCYLQAFPFLLWLYLLEYVINTTQQIVLMNLKNSKSSHLRVKHLLTQNNILKFISTLIF